MTNALKEYHEEVKTRQFPAPQNTYPIDPVQLDKFFALEKERMGIHEEEEAKSIHAL